MQKSDRRSYRVAFVSHCILSQVVMAEGVVKGHPSMIRPVIEWALENEINLEQMPCPEALWLGYKRPSHGKKWYEDKGFRNYCAMLVDNEALKMARLVDAGAEIVGVIGVVFSPACSTIKDSPSPYHPYGIFMEELEKASATYGLHPKFICVTERWMKKSKSELYFLLEPDQPFDMSKQNPHPEG